MKHGAADFLTKPVDDTELLAAIHEALAEGEVRRRAQVEQERVAKCLALLTERER
jgi:FixJ family two-component response regulator